MFLRQNVHVAQAEVRGRLLRHDFMKMRREGSHGACGGKDGQLQAVSIGSPPCEGTGVDCKNDSANHLGHVGPYHTRDAKKKLQAKTGTSRDSNNQTAPT